MIHTHLQHKIFSTHYTKKDLSTKVKAPKSPGLAPSMKVIPPPPQLPVGMLAGSNVTTTPSINKQSFLRNSLSMSDVSDMLLEFYKANKAAPPKNNKFEKYPIKNSPQYLPSTSTEPASITTTTAPVVAVPKADSVESHIPTTVVSDHISTAPIITSSKNVNGDEMEDKAFSAVQPAQPPPPTPQVAAKKTSAPFHPRIKYSSVNNKSVISSVSTSLPAIPAPAVVPAPVIQPPILPPPPAAAAIAAAFFRDGYHNLHQQIRAQELLQQPQHPPHPPHPPPIPPLPSKPQFYMQNFLRKENHSSENDFSSSDENDEDDEDEGKYPEIDDIHLIEGSKIGYSHQLSVSMDADYMSDHKYSMIAAHALRNLEYSLGEYNSNNPGEEPLYQCRHCGKKYRWKSTLRRHENVECGGKEPSHQCPYCPYKSKQRGNLGVHVRKHHSDLPQLASKRRSKYSLPHN